MKIVMDAHGGDHAPLEIVKGAALAAKEFDATLVLCGREAEIRAAAKEAGVSLDGMEIAPAEDVIGMEDDPVSILKEHAECSMARGLKMVAEGQGDAFLSAGSTGALVVGSRFFVKNMPGIKRAALAPILPSACGRYILADAGANVECRPDFLLKFAIMGSAYMSGILGVENPRVGLLCNGTEEGKGNKLTQEAYELLKAAPIHFVGNLEAREAPLGGCDVLVTDGFTGNIFLKLSEGMGKMVSNGLKTALKKNPVRLLGAALISGGLKEFKKSLDYKETGGAPLLGLRCPVIKAHGSSDAKAIYNAVRQAVHFVRNDVNGRIETMLQQTEQQEKE